MVLTTVNPSIAETAPAQASAEYQPIELPVTATRLTPCKDSASPKLQA